MSAWAKRRIRELSEELRRYPGPIARCDEHLAALLEERSRLISTIEKQTCAPLAQWTNDGGFNAA